MVQDHWEQVRAPAGARVPAGAGRRRGFGRGFGRSMGRGAWGFDRGVYGRPRWGWRAGSSGYGAAPQDEAQSLREEQAYLQNELEAIQKRIAELESS